MGAQSRQLAITSLSFLQGNGMFVCGSKAGSLRVWKAGGSRQAGETVEKEEVLITGAHSSGIVAVQTGPRVKESEDHLSFSSAAEDGKLLSFTIPAARAGSCEPFCFNVA